MSKKNTKWTHDDFESMSWHDNIIHGIRLCNPNNGYKFDLILQIDYILKWLHTAGHRVKFIIRPATLIFNNIDKLLIDIGVSYKESIIIDAIEREEITTKAQRSAGLRNYKWNIKLQSFANRNNKITFESTGFCMKQK